MAFDEALADRFRAVVARKKGVSEKKMFGGLGFLLNGNMLVGVWENSMIARIGPDQAEDALLEAHVRPMDITGTPMKGWVMIPADGVGDVSSVKAWVGKAITFVATLPKK
jgi:TfoX/Sxy family transcriptional regulator of competence genes